MAAKGSAGRPIDPYFRRSIEPVFLIGPDRRWSYVNPAWTRLTRVEAEQVVGAGPIAPGAPASDPPSRARAAFDPPSEVWEGQPVSTLVQLEFSDGPTTWHRVEYQPHRGETG